MVHDFFASSARGSHRDRLAARARGVRKGALCGAAAVAFLQAACSGGAPGVPANAIAVGALLPFSGDEAAMDSNLEQAMLLAAEDINAAGGVGGRPIAIVSRDSNSGSQRGFNELLALLYADQVPYLVGPEENDLANNIVADVKALDVLNVLPGYTAPNIKRVSTRGAWLRLAPSDWDTGCGMAKRAINAGVHSANAIVALDDYNSGLAATFNASFQGLGGTALPSITVAAGRDSYAGEITSAFNYHADRTLLIAYPATASTIVTEWSLSGHQGAWQLTPTLETKAFLLNTPFGALNGYSGVSPSLSLVSECQASASGAAGELTCAHDNAGRFQAHFAQRWGGAPFPAAHFYYDAVVLLAMGLQHGLAHEGQILSSTALQKRVRDLNAATNPAARWDQLATAMPTLAAGNAVRYVGAAAEYAFDDYGAALHPIMDTWTVDGSGFVDAGPIKSDCPRSQ